MSRLRIVALLFTALVTACSPAVTVLPTPTSTQSPLVPSWTTAPSATFTPEPPTATLPLPSPEPSSTQTLTPSATPATPLPTLFIPTASLTNLPLPAAQSSAIQFYTPGPLSQVTSPVRFFGYAVPGYNSKGLIELYGEDGSVLDSEVLQLNTVYRWAFFNWSLSFQARGAGELGRLSLSTRDQYGRLTAVQSLHLLLFPDGNEIINPPGSLAERCLLIAPLPGKRLSGGIVPVEGEMQAYNSLPLTVELVGRDGSILASQLVAVPSGQVGKAFAFRVEIPYIVTRSTPVLLTVRQADDRIPGTLYLYTQEITLNP